MFVIHYHNAHAYSNPGLCEIYGPFPNLDAAKQHLAKLVESMGDPLFKIDPNPYAINNDGTYAGYHYEDLINVDRDEDLASEIWAEVVRLIPDVP